MDKAAREKKEVTDDSRCENVCVCGNILVNVGITRQQSERASEQTNQRKKSLMIQSVTCGAEGYECLSVFADHRQLVFGKGQPAYDVLYKIIGDDRGHVPLQLPQHHQLPVLKKTEEEEEVRQRVKWRAAMPPLTVKKITARPYSQRKWLCKKSNIFSLYLSSLYLIICVPFSFLTSFVFITPACDKLCPANETASPFLPVTSLKQLQ